jgi:hypothetical protein
MQGLAIVVVDEDSEDVGVLLDQRDHPEAEAGAEEELDTPDTLDQQVHL